MTTQTDSPRATTAKARRFFSAEVNEQRGKATVETLADRGESPDVLPVHLSDDQRLFCCVVGPDEREAGDLGPVGHQSEVTAGEIGHGSRGYAAISERSQRCGRHGAAGTVGAVIDPAGPAFVRHNEVDRFRFGARDVRVVHLCEDVTRVRATEREILRRRRPARAPR